MNTIILQFNYLHKIRFFFFLSLLVIILIGCGSKQKVSDNAPLTIIDSENGQGDEQTNNEQQKYKVTFIELGSIRCIPCKMMQPIMKDIEAEYGDQVKVVFHDVWTEAGRPYAGKYGITAIPTQVFLDAEGKEYYRHTGFFAKDLLVEVLKEQGVR